MNGDSQPEHIRIGGMALENGVLFHSHRYWTMAVREADGEIRVVSGNKVKIGRAGLRKLPLLRSLINIAETALLLPGVHARGGQLPFPVRSPQVLASMMASLVGTIMVRKSGRRLSPLVEEAAVAALALIPSLVALRKTRAIQYHAAEHKSINAYEAGGVSGRDASSANAEHPRCGSNIVGPALAMMTVGNTLARRFLGRQSHTARLGVGVLSFTGAIEAVQWAARNPGNRWSKALTASGSGLQHLFTTGNPTEGQIEVGITALRELLRLEGALDPAPD